MTPFARRRLRCSPKNIFKALYPPALSSLPNPDRSACRSLGSHPYAPSRKRRDCACSASGGICTDWVLFCPPHRHENHPVKKWITPSPPPQNRRLTSSANWGPLTIQSPGKMAQEVHGKCSTFPQRTKTVLSLLHLWELGGP